MKRVNRFIKKFLKFSNKPNHVVHYKGKTYWVSRSCAVVSMVWLNVEGEMYILINQRGSGAPDYRGKWNLPCGYVDFNETLLEAAVRETYEETGLYMGNSFSFNEQPIFVSSGVTNNKQNISNYFKFYGTFTKEEFEDIKDALTDENCAEPNEVSDIRFIKFEDVDNYDFCFNHENRIKQFRKNI